MAEKAPGPFNHTWIRSGIDVVASNQRGLFKWRIAILRKPEFLVYLKSNEESGNPRSMFPSCSPLFATVPTFPYCLPRAEAGISYHLPWCLNLYFSVVVIRGEGAISPNHVSGLKLENIN